MNKWINEKYQEVLKYLEKHKIIGNIIKFISLIAAIITITQFIKDWNVILDWIIRNFNKFCFRFLFLLFVCFHFLFLPKYFIDKIIKWLFRMVSLGITVYVILILQDYRKLYENKVLIVLAVLVALYSVIYYRLKKKKYLDILKSLEKVESIKQVGDNVQVIAQIETHTSDKNKKENLNHIAYFYSWYNEKMLKELKNYRVDDECIDYNRPSSRNGSFKFILRAIDEIVKEGYVWFVNLIEPKTWFQNTEWKEKYSKKILEHIIKNKNIDRGSVRRLHILKKSDYYDKALIKDINTMLFLEWIAGIESKLLLIEDNKITELPQEIGVEIEEQFFIDYALFCTSLDERYSKRRRFVSCSDVNPYFFKGSKLHVDQKNVKIYNILNNYSWSKFYENFLTFWNFDLYIEKENINNTHNKYYELLDFYQILNTSIRINNIDWRELAIFVKGEKQKFSKKSTEEVEKQMKEKFDNFVKKGKQVNNDKENIESNFNKNFKKFMLK